MTHRKHKFNGKTRSRGRGSLGTGGYSGRHQLKSEGIPMNTSHRIGKLAGAGLGVAALVLDRCAGISRDDAVAGGSAAPPGIVAALAAAEGSPAAAPGFFLNRESPSVEKRTLLRNCPDAYSRPSPF